MKGLRLPLFLLGTAAANPALKEWLASKGGTFSDKLEVRADGGIFAKENVHANEVLLKVPPSAILYEPNLPLKVHDRVEVYYRRNWSGASIEEVQADGLYHVRHDHSDGSDEYDVGRERIREEFFLQCHLVRALAKEVELGAKSDYAILLDDLMKQPLIMPSAWSKTARELLRKVQGYHERRNEMLLPPDEPTDWSWEIQCRGPPEHSKYFYLMMQHGLVGRIIPFYYKFRHTNNGELLNTRTNKIRDNGTFEIKATRPVPAGSELFITMNNCEDCLQNPSYGTPELFRDKGVLEDLPQRWLFEDSELALELVPGDDGETEIYLKDSPSPFAIGTMKKQMERLQDLKETTKDKPQDVSQAEWDAVWKFHGALVKALETFLKPYKTADEETHCLDGEGTCPALNMRYDRLDDRPDKFDGHTHVCILDEVWKMPHHDFLESIDSQYQNIRYKIDRRNNDVCFDLDTILQICGSYRPHYHEMVVHYTARFLPEIKRVVFVGGGDSMLLHEIIKYPSLELVVGLELDQKVTRAAFKYFGAQPHWDNPKVQWWYGDATKSLLMLPKDYFGSFDMVLVDLSETVMSMTVTDELDVMEAFSLLLKPQGILVKNELYFHKMSKIFEYTVQTHYYDVPALCSQALIMGSNKVDFFRTIPKDHGVETLFVKPLKEIPDRFEIVHDFGQNTAIEQRYCKEKDEVEKEPTEQKKSPGIIMILEAERASASLAPAGDLEKRISAALEREGLTLTTSVMPDASDDDEAIFSIVFKEGYVVARTWPAEQYVAFDIHLWGSFDIQDAIQKALVSVVDSKLVSSYRIVAGGMFGVSTWKEDEKNKGPRRTQYCDSVDATVRADPMEEKNMDLILKESLAFVKEKKTLALVLCGHENDATCRSIDIAKKHKTISAVFPIWSCPILKEGVNEFTKGRFEHMMTCEKEILPQIKEAIQKSGRTVGAIIVDESAPAELTQIVHRIFTPKHNHEVLLSPNIVLLAPVTDKSETWRKNLGERFQRDIIRYEPAFRAEIFLNSTKSTMEMSVTACGDDLFITNMLKVLQNIEKQTGLVSQVRNLLGGDLHYQEEYGSQFFLPSDYDQTGPLAQYNSQKPLGFQTVFQLEIREKSLEYNVGDKVLANYEGEGEWFPARITAVHDDDTFDVEYDDGDEEDEVPFDSLQKPGFDAGSKTVALSSTQIKEVIEKTLTRMEFSGRLEESTGMGNGSVLVAIWSGGIVVVVWDGAIHVDLNLFTYEESVEVADKFSSFVMNQIPNLQIALRDEQPRGTGRVVNLLSDIEPPVKPIWAP